jgi:hypothetical protein
LKFVVALPIKKSPQPEIDGCVEVPCVIKLPFMYNLIPFALVVPSHVPAI